MIIPKETLGLAGEFAVASELCKRGIYAQLTFGNRKRTDLLVDNGESVLRVEVKSKQGNEWPGVKGIYLDGSIIVFVDFHGKEPLERPDFFVLTVKDWKSLARKKLRESTPGSGKLNEQFTLIWNGGKYAGFGIKPAQIEKNREAWHKFEPRKVAKTEVLSDIVP